MMSNVGLIVVTGLLLTFGVLLTGVGIMGVKDDSSWRVRPTFVVAAGCVLLMLGVPLAFGASR